MIQRFKLTKKLTSKRTLTVFIGIIVIVAVCVVLFARLQNNAGVYHPPRPGATGPEQVFPQLSSMPNNLKLRKSVTALTEEEKQDFIQAVQTLQATPSGQGSLSQYEQFVVQHILTMGFRQSLGATGPARGNPAHS